MLEAAELHPGRAARHHRRLRLLAVLRRHLDHAATRRSRRSAPAWRAPRWQPRCSGWSSAMATSTTRKNRSCARSRCRTRRASCWRASAPKPSCSRRRKPCARARSGSRAALAAASTATFRWVFASGTTEWDEMIGPLFGVPAAEGTHRFGELIHSAPCRRPPGRPAHGMQRCRLDGSPLRHGVPGHPPGRGRCAGWR